MKKHLLPLAAMLFSMSAFAQYSETASTDVYDISNYGPELIDLFYAAEQEGRLYPTQAEFEKAGFNMMDMAFVRSHVRPRSVMVDHSKDVLSQVTENRKLWMNVPIGIGKNQGGYPSSNGSDDTFTGWNYTNVFGSWNHGVFHVPGVAVDCAHKNGSDIYAGIKFFESWTAGSGAAGWVGMVQEKDANGYDGFKYVRPLVNAMMFFGQDGLNYNFEDTGYAQTDVVKFHQACYKYAAERGFNNFHIGIYTANSTLNSSNVEALFGKNGIKTADAFLNYASSDFQTANNIRNSVSAAETAMGTCDGVYQGAWIVSMNRSWSNLSANASSKKIGIVLWGEHNQSRLMSWNSGNSLVDFQENYQRLQDRFFSGGYRNPLSRPKLGTAADWTMEDYDKTALRSFCGLAEFIPERTAIDQNLPFTTYFNIGNGERYNYKGKKTLNSWYNLGQQDVVPTYRWLVYKKGTTTPVTDASYYDKDNNFLGSNPGIPEFTNADAYIGGSSLRLLNTEAVDIVLYRAKLAVTAGNPVATIALKCAEGTPKGVVSVIVKKQGSNTWEETQFANVKGNTWEEQTVSLNGVAQGDVIEYVGLRTSGDTKGLLVGQLTLNDDVIVEPAPIKEAVAEVKEETQVSLSVKLRWDVDAKAVTRADNDLLYNDEANIDHFEVLYKDGESGHVTEVARTTSWGAYVGNLPMEASTKPYIGVRAASVDGKTYSAVQWVEITRAEASQLPATSVANDAYPQMILNEGSEGLDNALNQRYITELKVEGSDGDFTYTNTVGTPYATDKTNKTNYIMADNVVKVHQGQDIKVTLTIAAYDDGLQWCTGRGYADWDADCNFNATNDELIWYAGKSNEKKYNDVFGSKGAEKRTVDFTFTVPTDAKPSASRLRLVFSDAWFPHPGPAGCNSKGFCLDFPMEITGTNAARQAVDTHDQGIAEEPVGLVAPEPDAIQVVKGGVSKATLDGQVLRFENTDKVWVISAEGRLVKYANGGVESLNTNGFTPGVYLIRMQCGQVQRTTKVIIK